MLNQQEKPKYPILKFFTTNAFLAFLGIALITGAVIFWRINEARNLAQIAAETDAQTRFYARETEFRFNSIYNALNILTDMAGSTTVSIDEPYWIDDAKFYVNSFVGLESIFLVDEDYIIRQIVSDEDVNLTLGQKATEVESASGEINIWIPIYSDDQFKGFILGFLQLESFMSPVVAELGNEYIFQLAKERNPVLESQTPYAPDETYESSEMITFQDTTVLTLSMSPSKSHIQQVRLSSRNTFLFMLLASFTTIAAVYTAQNFSAIAKQNQGRYLQLFNASLDAIFICDMQGDYVDANPAASALVGYTHDEIVTMNVDAIDYNDEHPPGEIRSTLWREGAQIEFELQHKDGHVIPVDLSISPIFNDGVQQFVLGIARDISARKQLELTLLQQQEQLEKMVQERTTELNARVKEVENLNAVTSNMLDEVKKANQNLALAQARLQSANEELESFSYSISHDLRAPLRHVDGFMSLLKEREEDNLDSTSLHYMENVTKAILRMGEMIDDLLSFSRTSRTAMSLQPSDPNLIVNTVIEELLPLPDEHVIEFDIQPLPPVMADPSLIKIVWDNLISNAIKFTAYKKEAHIEIGCKPNDANREVEFFIRDNGAGFNQQFNDKLFQVFQRLHPQDEFDGIGIGLATAKRIVSRHGGTIWAEGVEGEGATFHFTLKQVSE